CAVAATFSFAHGLIVWPIGLLLASLQRSRRRFWLTVWAAAFALTCAAYLWGYHGGRFPRGYLLTILRKPADALRMYLALAGNNFGEGRIPAMLAAGAVVLVVSLLAVAALWRLRGLRSDDNPWLALWLFSAASIFAVVLGRSHAWRYNVTASRHLSLAIFVPIATIVLLGRAGEELWRRGRRTQLAAAAAGLLLATAATRQAWATARLGWEIGAANRDLKLRTIPCVLHYRTADRECLSNLYVADGELVRRRAAILERWKLGPFAHADAAAAAAAVQLDAAGSGPGPALRGSVDFVGGRGPGGEDGAAGSREPVVAEGWTLAGDVAPAAIILEVDGRWVAASAAFFARPDVGKFFGRPVPPCGWRFVLPPGQLAAGAHVLRVLALAPGAQQPALIAGEKMLRVVPAAPAAAATHP
ncbi:MAG TPA: hypothetical protein VGV61_10215, partial [Thermoanaerobaculia bacterium]|nr:hypothetical protein [Thermoanaerobaculia bacterium]